MGLLREPVATRSHNSWNNLATRYGRFCVQKRTEEGLIKNTKFRHRWFYVAEDLVPFRIIYSTYPADFSDAIAASSPVGSAAAAAAAAEGSDGVVGSLMEWWNGKNTISSSGSTAGAGATAAASPTSTKNRNGAFPAASSSALSFFSPFTATPSSAGLMERFTVATSAQLSGILEAWGLLLEAWEPEEAELNVMTLASPAMASPTTQHSAARTTQAIPAPADAAGVPFFERWRRTYGRLEVLCAESGMERSMNMPGPYRSASTPPSPHLHGSVTPNPLKGKEDDGEEEEAAALASTELSPLGDSAPGSRSLRAPSQGGRGGRPWGASMLGSRSLTAASASDGMCDLAASRSLASRRHVHISDAYYADKPAPIATMHFFDVLLIRVVDLLMWRDPQLTACFLGVLVSVYGYAAWGSALCYLAGDTIAASSPYCTAVFARNGQSSALSPSLSAATTTSASSSSSSSTAVDGTASVQRLWWGAPLFMISVLAYPWTGEQQRRVLTATDREHLRGIHDAFSWLRAPGGSDRSGSEEDASPHSTRDAAHHSDSSSSVEGLTAAAVLLCVGRQVGTALWLYKLPIGLLLVFNIVGAFSSWEAILVLFLWPMLIVSVGLAGVVVVSQTLTG